MIVTFISECEKKAHNTTRRVLDSFADRIGTRTWQTIITAEGLDAVKRLLRQTATKSTAVACHRPRGNKRTELVWIVGNRRKFNAQGMVPISSTQILDLNTEHNWHQQELISSLAALAALFHDWGKASVLFQKKLKSVKPLKDPFRHEWISTLFLKAYVNGETDEQWLERLIRGDIDKKQFVFTEQQKPEYKALSDLPNAASMIGWLIVTHHRLPYFTDKNRNCYRGENIANFKETLNLVDAHWSYYNADKSEQIKDCFRFKEGIPSQSSLWQKYATTQALNLKSVLPALEESIANGSWRSVLFYARMSLMLGDHYYSSLESDSPFRLKQAQFKGAKLAANTQRYEKDGKPASKTKQSLDEHLLGVAKQARNIARQLPKFEGLYPELAPAHDIAAMKRKSPDQKYRWQDTAVRKITAWRKESPDLDNNNFGFFAVNIASTGTGKTFANAKIMHSLSAKGDSLRFCLALGLRTLTLQTGDEYRQRVGLKDDELAVLIGSKAVQQLHEKNTAGLILEDSPFDTGSASSKPLMTDHIDFAGTLAGKDLKTVLRNKKDRQLLSAPVLCCTVDHLISATQSIKGGRHILPSLRLMSSDLVIDEVDDFTDGDLIAIGRLIHHAAMLGRKVMISSATIPPSIAVGYYNCYQEGWKIFAAARGLKNHVGCAWVDEHTTKIETVHNSNTEKALDVYRHHHDVFITKRCSHLNDSPVKRRGTIKFTNLDPKTDELSRKKTWFNDAQEAVIENHKHHHIIDQDSGKRVSFGVVRLANIKPCVELTKFLLDADWPANTDCRTMAYHSQQVLLLRHEQEKHLDQILKRKGDQQALLRSNEIIQRHLKTSCADDLIFILVATPVEEVGRDHDFDWAVLDPSSYRSIIQLSGRVLRHRDADELNTKPNVTIMQFNIKKMTSNAGSTNKNKAVFCKPGYEKNNRALALATHDTNELLDVKALAKGIDAQARIREPNTLQPHTKLRDLEHAATKKLFDTTVAGTASMQGWLTNTWWLTGLPQQAVPFRASAPQLPLFRVLMDEQWVFAIKDDIGNLHPVEKTIVLISPDDDVSELARQRLWMTRDYPEILALTASEKDDESAPSEYQIDRAARLYGEINLPLYDNKTTAQYRYSDDFGLIKSD